MHYRLATATLGLALLFAACSTTDGPTYFAGTDDVGAADTADDSTRADAADDTDPLDDTDDATDGSGGGEPFPDTTFRIDGVNIIRPDGVGPILGNLITADIDAGILHGLIQFTEFGGPWPTTMKATGNVGQEAEGGYAWGDDIEVERALMEIGADGAFRGLETLSIVVPALEPGATEPIHIPAEVLEFDGEMFEFEGVWAIQGKITGAILAAEIEDITVNLGREQPLSGLLGGEEAMDYPPGAEGDELLGWSLEADIDAIEVTFVAAP